MQLQHLQRLFQRRILEGHSGIEAELAGSAAEDFPIRLAIYADAYRSRLLEMGLLVGTPVQLVRFAPLGDPVEIKVRGYHLTLRKQEAEQIWVQPED